MPQSYPPPASRIPYSEITTFMYSFPGGLVNLSPLCYRNNSSIAQIIIISITNGTTICNASIATINNISKIKKSVTNTQPIIHISRHITIKVTKNDINAFIYYKYNKKYKLIKQFQFFHKIKFCVLYLI